MIHGLKHRIRSLKSLSVALGTPEATRESIKCQIQSLHREIQMLERMDECSECFHTGCVCGGIGHSCYGCCACVMEG